jgi:hypothetical protein
VEWRKKQTKLQTLENRKYAAYTLGANWPQTKKAVETACVQAFMTSEVNTTLSG